MQALLEVGEGGGGHFLDTLNNAIVALVVNTASKELCYSMVLPQVYQEGGFEFKRVSFSEYQDGHWVLVIRSCSSLMNERVNEFLSIFT